MVESGGNDILRFLTFAVLTIVGVRRVKSRW